MDIDLVVTDLDGTLWELDDSVHDRTVDAIHSLVDADIPLLIATGRRVRSTQEPLAAIGLAPPAVVMNGTLGLDLGSGDRFHLLGYQASDALRILRVFLDHDVEPCVYTDAAAPSVFVGEAPATHPDHLNGFGEDVAVDDLELVVERETVLAFGVLGLPEAIAHALGAALDPIASPHVAGDRQYRGWTVTVAPPSQSKWDGIAAYCAQNGLDPDAVLVAGDGPNDLEMLEQAAVAVVPEDAHPEALAHADHVIPRALHGGWAEILDLL